jgi:hypothetical protein
MRARIQPSLDFIRNWIAFWRKLAQNRWLRLATQGLVGLFCLGYLFVNFKSLQTAWQDLQPKPGLILAAGGVTMIAVFLGVVGWWQTLRGCGQRLSWWEAMHIHLYSNLAKYLPGYAWQLLGKAYLTRQAGVPAYVVGLSMSLELFQLVTTGAWVMVIFSSGGLESQPGMYLGWLDATYVLPVQRILFVILTLVLVGWPGVAAHFVRRWLPEGVGLPFDTLHMVIATAAILVGWLLFGVSFWMLSVALEQMPFDLLPLYVFTLAASFLIGLAILVVPGSIGIREGVMVWLLGPVTGIPLAVVIAALARLVLTSSELLSVLIYIGIRRMLSTQNIAKLDY